MTVIQHAVHSQGSLWRRWDPHVHLPGTVINDQFGDMPLTDALKQLAGAQPLIEAIGVTDYFTTASYRCAAAALATGIAPGIRLAFPNVELRLDNATSSNHGVNIHLLSSPDEADQLDHFIGGLEFSWSEKLYRADRDGLIRLGRDYSANASLEETAAIEIGTNQFKVNFEHLRQRVRTDKWAMENILVAVAGGGRDGTSGLRVPDGAFAARRESIQAFAHIVLSGNPKQAQFWSGMGDLAESELDRIYGGPKLCLHGSDAHDASRLGVPDHDRYCWLKGDPSIETLRLACLSPMTRAYVGQEPPATSSTFGRITKLTVPSEDWFVNTTVNLNPGLVAIIGARGSGKTALADLVAAGAGSNEPFTNDSSFISRAGPLLRDAIAAVDWSHGAITTCNLRAGNSAEPYSRPVRYLSQQFVERLCASDGVSNELLSEIARVIFEAWPVDKRQGAATFGELLDIRLASARESQSAQLEAVLDLSNAIVEMRLRRDTLLPNQERMKELEKQLTRITDEISTLTKDTDKTSTDRYEAVSTALRTRQDEIQSLDRRLTGLKGVQNAVHSARSTFFPGYLERLQNEHSEADLTVVDWPSKSNLWAMWKTFSNERRRKLLVKSLLVLELTSALRHRLTSTTFPRTTFSNGRVVN